MPLNNLYISNSDKRPVTPALLIQKLWLLVLFILVFLLGLDYFYMNYVVISHEWSNAGKVNRLIHNDNTNEIPVFGASVARSSFMPDSISVDCYNYGMGKALFDVTRVLVKIECAKDKSGPIIFEINPRTFIKNPQSSINNSAFIPSLNNPVIENFMRESGLFSWHYKVPGMRFYGNYFEYSMVPLRRISDSRMDNRGAMIEKRVLREKDFKTFQHRMANVIKKRERLMEKQYDAYQGFSTHEEMGLKALTDMIYFSYDSAYVAEFEGYISENPKRQFLLVAVPLLPEVKEIIGNYSGFEAFATALAAKYENAHFMDYSDLPMDLTHFKDPTHFNETGSRAFSSVFAKDFEALTGISAHSESDY